MKTIHGIENFPASEGSIVTIGTFDGVHLGHQQILKQLIDTSQQSKLKSVLLTFFSSPQNGASTRYFYASYPNH